MGQKVGAYRVSVDGGRPMTLSDFKQRAKPTQAELADIAAQQAALDDKENAAFNASVVAAAAPTFAGASQFSQLPLSPLPLSQVSPLSQLPLSPFGVLAPGAAPFGASGFGQHTSGHSQARRRYTNTRVAVRRVTNGTDGTYVTDVTDVTNVTDVTDITEVTGVTVVKPLHLSTCGMLGE